MVAEQKKQNKTKTRQRAGEAAEQRAAKERHERIRTAGLTRIARTALAVAMAATIGTMATMAPDVHAQYTTDWLANTYGTIAAHVGNGARSMWVSPEGVIYTSSLWDENEGGVAIYQNGQSAGSIGIHSEFQGSAITGNVTSIFAALQYSTTYGSGAVGRLFASLRAGPHSCTRFSLPMRRKSAVCASRCANTASPTSSSSARHGGVCR